MPKPPNSIAYFFGTNNFIKKNLTVLMMMILDGMPEDIYSVIVIRFPNGDTHSKEADTSLSVIYQVMKTAYCRGYQTDGTLDYFLV